MGIVLIYCFALNCYSKMDCHKNGNSEVDYTDEYMMNNTPNLSATPNEATEICMTMMIIEENKTSKIYDQMCNKLHVMNISNVVSFLHSLFITYEMTYHVVKELTGEDSIGIFQNADLNLTGSICLCSVTKFNSKIEIAEDGLKRLNNYLAELKLGLEGLNVFSFTEIETLFNICKILTEDYTYFREALEIYYDHVFDIEVENQISSMDSEYRIFLQHKFCCLLNSFILVLDNLIEYLRKYDIKMKGLDFSLDFSQIIYITYPQKKLFEKGCTENQYIMNTIEIFYILYNTHVTVDTHFVCFGAFLNLKKAYWRLDKQIEEEENTEKCMLNDTLVEELREFIESKKLCSLSKFYNEYLDRRINALGKFMIILEKRDIKNEKIKEFIFAELSSLANTLTSFELSELLRWAYSVIYFVNQSVLSAQKTNFNIFLGFASIELISCIILIHVLEPIQLIESLSFEWIESINYEFENKFAKTLIEGVDHLIKVYSGTRKTIELLNIGWLKDNEIDSFYKISAERNLEIELLEYMKNFEAEYFSN